MNQPEDVSTEEAAEMEASGFDPGSPESVAFWRFWRRAGADYVVSFDGLIHNHGQEAETAPLPFPEPAPAPEIEAFQAMVTDTFEAVEAAVEAAVEESTD